MQILCLKAPEFILFRLGLIIFQFSSSVLMISGLLNVSLSPTTNYLYLSRSHETSQNHGKNSTVLRLINVLNNHESGLLAQKPNDSCNKLLNISDMRSISIKKQGNFETKNNHKPRNQKQRNLGTKIPLDITTPTPAPDHPPWDTSELGGQEWSEYQQTTQLTITRFAGIRKLPKLRN